jgi:hypothetical protein
VTLTPYPLLVPWSRKSRAIPLLCLWAVWPVQSLSACTLHLSFTLYNLSFMIMILFSWKDCAVCIVVHSLSSHVSSPSVASFISYDYA